jgi:hypothetical protein
MKRAVAGLMVLALVAAGCGGGDSESAATKTATPTPVGADLQRHMLAADDLPGAAAAGKPLLVKEPEAWVIPSGRKNAEAVRASGFIEGMEQRYDIQAINLAARFKSPEQAEAEVAFVPPTPPGEKIKTTEFKVPGVPSAIGRKTTSDLHANGHNITFAAGDYFHLIAAKATDVSRADLIAATQRLYERVK